MTITFVSQSPFQSQTNQQLIYTTLLILIQVSAKYATNLFPASELDSILSNPTDIQNRIYGSKIVIGLEQCMLLSTWGVKTCLVTLYWKLTKRLPWHLFVQILAGYIVLGFAVIEITYFAAYCRPFSQYWAVPVQNPQCATYQHYSITQAVFNLSSDACMLVIPVPLLKDTQMPRRKKTLLISVLGLGVFVMVAAILNKYFNFHSPDTTIYQLWYIREASTAIYVANLMCWWPLLWRVFVFGSLAEYSGGYMHRYYGGPSGVHRSSANGTGTGDRARPRTLSRRAKRRSPRLSLLLGRAMPAMPCRWRYGAGWSIMWSRASPRVDCILQSIQ
ncbi:hypothetical protein BDV18DRAFT_145446 [Aspergillus unguis]